MFQLNKTNINNFTLDALSNPNSEWYIKYFTEPFKIFVIAYLTIIFAVGFVGNTIALLGSVFHDAIKTDQISVLLLRILAIVDIALSVFLYVPVLTTLIMNRWALGDGFCLFSYYAHEITLLWKLFLITVISCYRIWMLKKPPGVKNNLKKRPFVLLLAALLLLSALPLMLLELTLDGARVIFDPRSFHCYGDYFYGKNAVWTFVTMTIVILPPVVIILATNFRLVAVLLAQARKSRSRFLDRRMFIIIKFIRIFITITYLPPLLYAILDFALWEDIERRRKVREVMMAITLLLPLNCTLSPIMYVLSNQTFRDYLLGCCGFFQTRQRILMSLGMTDSLN